MSEFTDDDRREQELRLIERERAVDHFASFIFSAALAAKPHANPRGLAAACITAAHVAAKHLDTRGITPGDPDALIFAAALASWLGSGAPADAGTVKAALAAVDAWAEVSDLEAQRRALETTT